MTTPQTRAILDTLMKAEQALTMHQDADSPDVRLVWWKIAMRLYADAREMIGKAEGLGAGEADLLAGISGALDWPEVGA